MNIPEKTFLDWCKEYEKAVDGLEIIIKELKVKKELCLGDYAKYEMLINANRRVKEYAEKQIFTMLNQSDINPQDRVEGMNILAIAIGKGGNQHV